MKDSISKYRKCLLKALPVLVVSTAALAAASSGGPKPEPRRIDRAVLIAVFQAAAAAEPALRRDAKAHFPDDPWSQDDDFHNAEQQLAHRLAATHHIGLQDVLRAVDLGMRENWALPPGVQLRLGVPPCHPRSFYD